MQVDRKSVASGGRPEGSLRTVEGVAMFKIAWWVFSNWSMKGGFPVFISITVQPRLQMSALCQQRDVEASFLITSGALQRGVPGPMACLEVSPAFSSS